MNHTTSRLLLPSMEMASCVSAAIFRDTSGTALTDNERLNYFPASPLHSVTIVTEGALHIADQLCGIEVLQNIEPVTDVAVLTPRNKPIVSWSPGPVTVITVGFFPDAWRLLGGNDVDAELPEAVRRPMIHMTSSAKIDDAWTGFCNELSSNWTVSRQTGNIGSWAGSDRIADWSRYITTRMALSGPGRSIRAMERRLRNWTGQTRQSIEFYSKIEELYRLRTASPETPLAVLASEAEFSDQSHMGRAVKKITGFPPARLNHLIETEEAFWFYRLMGARF